MVEQKDMELTSCHRYIKNTSTGLPGGSVVKNLPTNAGNMGLIPGLGRYHILWGS